MRIRYLSGCVAILAIIWATGLFTSSDSMPPDQPASAPSMSIEFKAGTARHWLKHNEVQLERTIMRAP